MERYFPVAQSRPKSTRVWSDLVIVQHKIDQNLVISNWLWWIMHVRLASQNWGNILNEK